MTATLRLRSEAAVSIASAALVLAVGAGCGASGPHPGVETRAAASPASTQAAVRAARAFARSLTRRSEQRVAFHLAGATLQQGLTEREWARQPTVALVPRGYRQTGVRIGDRGQSSIALDLYFASPPNLSHVLTYAAVVTREDGRWRLTGWLPPGCCPVPMER